MLTLQLTWHMHTTPSLVPLDVKVKGLNGLSGGHSQDKEGAGARLELTWYLHIEGQVSWDTH